MRIVKLNLTILFLAHFAYLESLVLGQTRNVAPNFEVFVQNSTVWIDSRLRPISTRSPMLVAKTNPSMEIVGCEKLWEKFELNPLDRGRISTKTKELMDISVKSLAQFRKTGDSDDLSGLLEMRDEFDALTGNIFSQDDIELMNVLNVRRQLCYVGLRDFIREPDLFASELTAPERQRLVKDVESLIATLNQERSTLFLDFLEEHAAGFTFTSDEFAFQDIGRIPLFGINSILQNPEFCNKHLQEKITYVNSKTFDQFRFVIWDFGIGPTSEPFFVYRMGEVDQESVIDFVDSGFRMTPELLDSQRDTMRIVASQQYDESQFSDASRKNELVVPSILPAQLENLKKMARLHFAASVDPVYAIRLWRKASGNSMSEEECSSVRQSLLELLTKSEIKSNDLIEDLVKSSLRKCEISPEDSRFPFRDLIDYDLKRSGQVDLILNGLTFYKD